ncbi:response regulator transcription factor [Paenibacillus sp. GD4]|uniref:response regulator transcription factor n=1 Tax=Paenibacillus sp. GD4 TaxID=3068890 RepID=UPI0027967698|nr:response regulator transcription factor [Paenibacillus sp. GD4]MDQ1909070.1 response regulator transcription factor [Paenibacillus sp. GD4]
MGKSILVVDDDRNICAITKLYLQKNGYEVTTVHSGTDALKEAAATTYSLIVLDLMLPGMDGWTVCQRLRETSNVPIIMLTARGETQDKIGGLRMGADDYMVKPFDPNELIARIETVLRRTEGIGEIDKLKSSGKQILQYDSLRIDKLSYEVFCEDRPVPLRRKEFELLRFMAEHPNRVFTRTELIEHVWGWDFEGEDRIVDAYIKRIREALNQDDSTAWSLDTVRGVGYKFRVSR